MTAPGCTVMTTLPNYDLYGSEAKPAWMDSFSFEWIPERSRPNNWEIDPHTHDSLIQVLYILAGGGEALIEGARWAVRPPCLIVIPARTVHGFRFTETTDGPVVTSAQRPLEALITVARPELLHHVRTPAVLALQGFGARPDALMPLFRALESEARAYAPGQITAGSSLLLALVVQVARISARHRLERSIERTRATERMERFRELVDRHFRDRLPLTRYAEALSVSTGQLARLCRQHLGMSPLSAINARIVHEAERELVYSVLSVKQIAAHLGFDDEAYFTRFFRKQTGTTPGEFRVMARKRLARVRDESRPTA